MRRAAEITRPEKLHKGLAPANSGSRAKELSLGGNGTKCAPPGPRLAKTRETNELARRVVRAIRCGTPERQVEIFFEQGPEKQGQSGWMDNLGNMSCVVRLARGEAAHRALFGLPRVGHVEPNVTINRSRFPWRRIVNSTCSPGRCVSIAVTKSDTVGVGLPSTAKM